MERTEEQPVLCSRKRAAFLLSVSVRQVDYLIELGHFKVTRIGSRVLIHVKQIERFAKGDWPQLSTQQRGSMPREDENPSEDHAASDGDTAQSEERRRINQPLELRQQMPSENAPEKGQANHGRPRKYFTERERQDAAKKYGKDHRERLRTRVRTMFLKCARCSAPATCIHWVGEHGQGPRENQHQKWARVVREPEYAANFAGFCKYHKPEPHFTRAAKGEVPRPWNWGKGSVPERG